MSFSVTGFDCSLRLQKPAKKAKPLVGLAIKLAGAGCSRLGMTLEHLLLIMQRLVVCSTHTKSRTHSPGWNVYRGGGK
jgi:hypothetical protein